MLTGIFIIIALSPFFIFFQLWNGIFNTLGLSLDIPIPTGFNDLIIGYFKKAYLFDSIFPTATFINMVLLALNFFIAIRIWILMVWVYNRIRGA